MFISVLVLALGACAGSPQAGRGASGQTPVEIKESIFFADGALDEFTAMEYDPEFSTKIGQSRYSASGALLEQVEFSYNDQGSLSGEIVRDMESRLKNRVVYEYNDQGLLWKETRTNKDSKPISSFEYRYDEGGNLAFRAIFNAAGSKLAETAYTLNSDGLAIGSETTDGSGKKISSTENQYDSAGRLTGQKIYNAAGELSVVIKAVWRGGNEVESEQQGADGSVQLKVFNSYGSKGELLSKRIENLQGESTQIVKYDYTFKSGQ
jgi:hypothetical protein